MSLPTNNKKAGNKTGKNQANNSGSKFIKVSSKATGGKQKVRSTGANRGS